LSLLLGTRRKTGPRWDLGAFDLFLGRFNCGNQLLTIRGIFPNISTRETLLECVWTLELLP
jgi:hypothetical protein